MTLQVKARKKDATAKDVALITRKAELDRQERQLLNEMQALLSKESEPPFSTSAML